MDFAIRRGALGYEASSPPVGSAHISFGVLFNEALLGHPPKQPSWPNLTP
jgi:hypothetical protein